MAHSTFEFHCAHVSSNLLSPSCQQEIFPSLPSLCFSGFLAFSTPSPFSFSTSHKGPSAGLLWAAFPVSPVSRWSQPFLNKMVRHHVCMKTSECVNKSEDRVLHRPKCESVDNKYLKLLCCFPCHYCSSLPHLCFVESSFYEAKIVSNFGKERQTGTRPLNVPSTPSKLKVIQPPSLIPTPAFSTSLPAALFCCNFSQISTFDPLQSIQTFLTTQHSELPLCGTPPPSAMSTFS